MNGPRTAILTSHYLFEHLGMEGALQQIQHPELLSGPGEGWHGKVILEQDHLGVSCVHPVARNGARAHGALLLDENAPPGAKTAPRVDPVPQQNLFQFNVS